MKSAVEISYGAMVYIPSFIKIGSGIQKLMRDGIHRQARDRISRVMGPVFNTARGVISAISYRSLMFLLLSCHLYFMCFEDLQIKHFELGV
jgi:hypothetical protein